jgi:hypothetical protein
MHGLEKDEYPPPSLEFNRIKVSRFVTSNLTVEGRWKRQLPFGLLCVNRKV